MRQQAGILDQLHRPVGPIDVILHVRDRADQVQVELALQPLAHDLHVQQAEETAAEAKPKCHRGFGLVMERRVIELELGERVPQLLVLLGIRRIEAREHHRLDVPITRQQLDLAVLGVQHGVTRPYFPHAAHVGDHVPDFAGLELLRRLVAQLEIAYFIHFVHVIAMGTKRDLHPRFEDAVHDPNRRNRAAIPVVVGVKDEGAERGLVLATRRRHAGDYRFDQLRHAATLFGRDPEDLVGFGADQIMDFVGALVGLSARKIDLVEDGYDFQAGIHGQQEIGQGLGLDPLRRIHDQNGAFTRYERPRHLVRKVDMPGRIDKIELIQLPIFGVVAHPHGIQLDRDAALALQVHRIEDLLAHQSLVEGARELDQAVGKRRFAVVDMSNDTEIANMVLSHRAEI